MSSLSTTAWHKSGRSTNGGDCAEVTIVPADDPSVAEHKAASGGKELYVLRDSKDPDGPKLYFTDAEWEAFVGGVKDGEFDVRPAASVPDGDDASAQALQDAITAGGQALP
ncbi:DUF397 domain-containing protein [Streptosporangium subroseum]|uniref:DUF397 domain-containing protein n=1 Tax=Streptosporangium subroseum TaxID=106412 RepID=UPI0034134F02